MYVGGDIIYLAHVVHFTHVLIVLIVVLLPAQKVIRNMSYHIFGDSNISRYLPTVKETSTDPQYETITYTKVTNLVLLRDALSLPDVAYPVIVISALTNLLVAKYFDDFDEMLKHCKTVFNELLTWVQEGRNTCPGFAEQVHLTICVSL
jgi:hypothetical protein